MSELHGNIGPTRNYENLTNLPSINDVKVVGNLTPSDLGLADDASVEEIRSALENKVDKVTGKGLSENDYTDGEKAKLEGIEAGAEKNVQSDWDASDGSDAFIKNKPSVLETVTIRGTATTKSGTNTDLDVYKTAEVDSAIDTLDNKIDTNVADLDERKAETDGYYETLTSGQTEQIIATEAITDTEPYIYRKTGGANDVGDRVFDTLVGGSVVWNQLVKNGDFASNSDWTAQGAGTTISIVNGKLTLTVGTAAYSGIANTRTNQSAVEGHKHLITATLMSDTTFTSCDFAMHTGTAQQESGLFTLTANARTTVSKIMSVSSSLAAGNKAIQYQVWVPHANAVEGATVEVSKVSAINLTIAVGTLIADYVYSLETATAGAGVAWFKKYFPKEYYAYAEPHFEHVQTSAKETVGFNLCGGGYDKKYWSDAGVLTDNNSNCCTEKIRALPNTDYYFCDPGNATTVKFFDSEMNLISKSDIAAAASNRARTSPAGTCWIVANVGRATFPEDFCFNLHGDRDGEYEPYRKRTYPLDSSLTLRGIPKLDSANRLYFDGDIYRHDGSGEQRYLEVDLGSLNWTVYKADRRIYRATVANLKTVYASQIANVVTPKYKTVSGAENWQNGDIATTSSSPGYIFICDTAYADAASFKTAMSGQMLVYEANTPEPFTAEPFQSPMVVDPLGTEEFIDYGVEEGARDVAIPVGHNSEYPADLRGKLQRLPSPTGTNGDYVITEVDGKLYLKPYVPAVGLTAPTTEGEGE